MNKLILDILDQIQQEAIDESKIFGESMDDNCYL